MNSTTNHGILSCMEDPTSYPPSLKTPIDELATLVKATERCPACDQWVASNDSCEVCLEVRHCG